MLWGRRAGLVVALTAFVLLAPIVAAWVAPTLLLVWALRRGIHPGEQLILHLVGRHATRRRARSTLRAQAPRRPILVRRVGRTLAAALAVRPPPQFAGSLS